MEYNQPVLLELNLPVLLELDITWPFSEFQCSYFLCDTVDYHDVLCCSKHNNINNSFVQILVVVFGLLQMDIEGIFQELGTPTVSYLTCTCIVIQFFIIHSLRLKHSLGEQSYPCMQTSNNASVSDCNPLFLVILFNFL